MQTYLCSLVIWYNPEVPCDVINGYSVRFFHPQGEHQNVTRHLGTNGTFYVIKDEDIAEINNATSVQVGVGLITVISNQAMGCNYVINFYAYNFRSVLYTALEWESGVMGSLWVRQYYFDIHNYANFIHFTDCAA